jgi:hypothetical protein
LEDGACYPYGPSSGDVGYGELIADGASSGENCYLVEPVVERTAT